MKTARTVLVVLALALLVPACKTTKTKVCDHLEELMRASGDDAALDRPACEEQVRNYERTCAAFDEVVDCWLAAGDRREFGSCATQCEGEGGE